MKSLLKPGPAREGIWGGVRPGGSAYCPFHATIKIQKIKLLE
jgi:hypothetical protein